LIAAFGAFWWRRHGFGPGRPVFFPLGETGLIGFSALFTAAASLLGLDAVSQVHRAGAQRLYDTRPVADWLLAASRWITSALLTGLVAALFLLETYLLSLELDHPCPWQPLAALWGFWWMPLIALASALGLALRSWIRNDAAAVFLALLLLLALAVPGWFIFSPPVFFDHYAPNVGLILPFGFYIMDLIRALVLSLALMGIGAVGQRHWSPRTPVRTQPPYRRKSLPTFRRLAAAARQWTFTDRTTALATLVLIVLAAILVSPWIDEWRFFRPAHESWIPERALLPVDLTARELPRWKIRHLEADLGGDPSSPPDFTLLVENPTTQTLRTAAIALSTVWDNVTIQSTPARPGPIPGTWIFEWNPPLDRLTARTLSIQAAPRPGSERLHALARNPRYSDWGRLGAWWPRAATFDLTSRSALVPDQPLSYRLRIETPETSGTLAVCGSARAQQVDSAWELTSVMPESRLFPVIASYILLEHSFDGLPVRVCVFSRHRELVEFLFKIWSKPFLQLRRALGTPPAQFVFHEAAIAPAQPDPLALPSPLLDALDDAMPDYDAPEDRTFGQFNKAFGPWQRAILQAWTEAAFGAPREPVLLRDSLVEYLHQYAFNRGLQPPPEEARERPRPSVPFVPWRGRPPDAPPFDFRQADLALLRLPWDEAAEAASPDNPLLRRRAQSAHHLVRYLLGDIAYSDFLKQLLARNPATPLTREEFLALAQQHTDHPVRPVLDQILGPAQLPTFTARNARVFLDRDAETRALVYTTEVEIANTGQGAWPVPVLLTTEDDQFQRRIDLGPGQSQTLQFKTPSRPLGFFVDPYGWLPQIPRFDPDAKSATHPAIYLKRVTSRIES
jgi:hypothetical protein